MGRSLRETSGGAALLRRRWRTEPFILVRFSRSRREEFQRDAREGKTRGITLWSGGVWWQSGLDHGELFSLRYTYFVRKFLDRASLTDYKRGAHCTVQGFAGTTLLGVLQILRWMGGVF
jgi:hypothetical protein